MCSLCDGFGKVVMDLYEISQWCESLNLDDRGGPIVRIEEGKYSRGKEKMGLCLIGKILGNKLANWDAFERVMRRAW